MMNMNYFKANRDWLLPLISTLISAIAPIMLISVNQMSHGADVPVLPAMIVGLSKGIIILGSFITAYRAKLTDTLSGQVVAALVTVAGLAFVAVMIFR